MSTQRLPPIGRLLAATALGAGVGAALPATASAEVFVVNTLNSANSDGFCSPVTPNGDDCSLADAIDVTNRRAGTDQITFSSSLSGTITPVVDLPAVSQNVEIIGPGPETLAISGGAARRILAIDPLISVDIDGLTFRNGHSESAPESGGAIYAGSGSVLAITNAVFTDNKAVDLPTILEDVSGGAIYAATDSRLEISDSTFSGNLADGTPDSSSHGGAIASRGTVDITGSTLSGNIAAGPGEPGVYGEGGAIWIRSARRLTVRNSTISGNQATGENGSGGGIFSYTRKAIISNSTISGNSANSRGGGAVIGGRGRVSSSTIANNSAGQFGGGLYGTPDGLGGSAGLVNTIVADNSITASIGPDSDGDDVYDRAAVADFTLIERTDSALSLSGSNNVLRVDPGLAPLADNGGPTLTQAIGATSAAVDVGRSSPDVDQRGVLRPQGAADDIGAFEVVGGGRDSSPKSVEGPRVGGPRKQRQGGKRVKIKLTAKAAEAVKIIARGRITLGGGRNGNSAQAAAKSFRLAKVRKQAAAGERTKLRLSPKRKRDSKRIIKLLRRGKNLRAETKVKLTDVSGNSTVKKKTVRLKAK